MDEVESHLHPEWQRRIVPSVLKVLEELQPGMKVQTCLTTQGPLVLGSLEPISDQQRDRFYAFGLNNGEVELNQIRWVNQRTAVDWLLSEAFTFQDASSAGSIDGSPKARACAARAAGPGT